MKWILCSNNDSLILLLVKEHALNSLVIQSLFQQNLTLCRGCKYSLKVTLSKNPQGDNSISKCKF
jgi:hypothetical protein